jgi:uncharacterized cupredoxin-like copper-binding protein
MSLVSAGRRAGLVLLVAGATVLAACGGGESGGSSSSSEKSSGSSSGGAGGALTAALSEWALKPSASSAKAGKVEIKVSNSGTTPHELVIVKTDVAHDKLEQANGLADEAKYKPVVRTKQLNGGESETLSAELAAGKYVLLCNISGHYGLGMHAAFTVN